MQYSYRHKVFYSAILIIALIVTGCISKKGDQGENKKNIFPNKPIEVVVGWGAGGGTDIFSRAITKPVADKFDVPINVKNMPGASGAVAGGYLLQQPADGYTVWAMTTTFVINSLLGNSEHKLDEFIPLARVQHDTSTIQVAKNSQFKTIDELVSYAKEHSGELKVGVSGSQMSGGIGIPGFDEIVVALFEEAAEINLKTVPFEDAGKMHTALFNNEIDLMVEEFGPTIKYIKEERIIPLIAFTDKRIEDFPKLPIALEKGWDVTLGVWRGLMIKANTPQDRVEILGEAFQEAFEDPGYKESERLRYLHLRPGYLKSEDFTAAIKEELDIYRKMLKKLGYLK